MKEKERGEEGWRGRKTGREGGERNREGGIEGWRERGEMESEEDEERKVVRDIKSERQGGRGESGRICGRDGEKGI